MNISRKKSRVVFNIAVTIFCLVCLVLFCVRLWEERGSVADSFELFFCYKWLIFAEVALMALNIFIESMRWRVLRGIFTSGSFADDLTATLRSISLGNMTVANVGEHVGRFLCYADNKSAGVASLVASVVQTASIVILGGVALLCLSGARFVSHEVIVVAVVVLTVSLIIGAVLLFLAFRYFSFPEGWGRGVVVALMLNILKVAVFSFQLSLLLIPGDIPSMFVFVSVLLYYFFVTIVPRINIIDIGVKGGLATWIFSTFASGGVISSAVIFIWALNIVFPSLFGFASFVGRRRV